MDRKKRRVIWKNGARTKSGTDGGGPRIHKNTEICRLVDFNGEGKPVRVETKQPGYGDKETEKSAGGVVPPVFLIDHKLRERFGATAGICKAKRSEG